MANSITSKTICRAITGMARIKTYDAFVLIGGDYRSEQNSNSKIQRFINWLAQCIDKNYVTRTQSEVNYKKQALGDGFISVAEQILKAKFTDDTNVNIKLEIDNETLEIVSYPGDPDKLFVRQFWDDRELVGINLTMLKSIMLKEYLRYKRNTEVSTEQIVLTGFCLNNLDLRSMDFKNCSLPDLFGCRLNGIDFDMTTIFMRREMCQIDDRTFDRLQDHNVLSMDLVVPELLQTRRLDVGEIDPKAIREVRKIRSYDIDEIFSSDNPDLATKKRHHLQYDKDCVVACFRRLNLEGIPINLAYVDLRELDLSNLDLAHANLFGANLTNANLRRANLIRADLERTILWETDLRDADLAQAKMDHAKINIFIRRSQRAEVFQNICAQYDKGNISCARVNNRDVVVYYIDD